MKKYETSASERTIERYIRMLKVGVSPEAVRRAMMTRGIDSSLMRTVLGSVIDIPISPILSPIATPVDSRKDSVVESVVKKFLERSEVGTRKYGVTLDRTDLKPLDWIVHAQEELMDGILYLEKLKQTFSDDMH
jgi:hypothetical protein